jgi:Tfp pilus assembly protein PilO
MPATDALKPPPVAALVDSGRWRRRAVWLRGPLLLIGVLSVTLAGLYVWWIHPLSEALSAQEAQSQEDRRRLQELFLYQNAKRDLDALTQRFPSKKELPQAIGQISTLGHRAGVSIPEMNFQPAATASSKWSKVTLQFTARGSYAGIRRFVAAVEGAVEPFVIESMDLKKDKRSGGVEAKLIVGLYARDD